MSCRALVVVLCVFMLSACSGYVNRFARAISDYEHYRYDDAVKAIDAHKPKKKDELLYFLDKGMILHAAGKYSESIVAFTRAEDLAAEIVKHIGHEVLSLATNDNALPYVGDPYERLMIPIWNALNYAALGKNDEALIEVRKYHTLYESIYGHELPKPGLRNAFDEYVSGILWEANHLPNDAYIDYRTAYKMLPTFPYLASDLPRLATVLGFPDAVKVWELEFGKWKPSGACLNADDCGELVFVLEAGLSPDRLSSEWTDPVTLDLFPVPRYEERPTRIDHVVLTSEGREIAHSQSLVSLTALAKVSLAKAMPKIAAKAVGRTVLKEGAAVAVGKKVDKDLGYLLGILFLATNNPDFRHWQTLPDTLSIARISLAPGDYDIDVHFKTSSDNEPHPALALKQLHIEAGKTIVVPYRSFE